MCIRLKINKNMFAGKIATCNATPQNNDLLYITLSVGFTTLLHTSFWRSRLTKQPRPIPLIIDIQYTCIYIPYVSICQIDMIATAKMIEK